MEGKRDTEHNEVERHQNQGRYTIEKTLIDRFSLKQNKRHYICIRGLNEDELNCSGVT